MTDPTSVATWLDEVAGEEWTWFAKRLSANDTGLTASHQAGIYLPKEFAFPLLGLPYPLLDKIEQNNPDRLWTYRLVSHGQGGQLRLTYYNQGSRNECRLTRFGGRTSPLQNPENTSALLVMAFGEDNQLQAWLARDLEEEEVIEARTGQVVPGFPVYRRVVDGRIELYEILPTKDVCDVTMDELPRAWALEFPAPIALTEEAVRRVTPRLDPDARLLRRYECEFRLFRVVEEAHVLPAITRGFTSVDEFLGLAQTVLNRRKSRAGRALELQLAAILAEEGVAYAAQAQTEPGSIVDFLFPSLERYGASHPGDGSIQMLAVKTTLRDRWRQVLAEGSKIPTKHLFTLDEGVSLAQYQEMRSRDLRLVVPQRNVAKFPEPVRLDLMTLDQFLEVTKALPGPVRINQRPDWLPAPNGQEAP